MSKVQVDNIVNKEDTGAPTFPKGVNIVGVISSTNANIFGITAASNLITTNVNTSGVTTTGSLIATITSDCGKNAVQVLTKTEHDSVADLYFAAQALFVEAQQAKQDDDEELATTKETEAQTKLNQALTALRTL